MAKILKSLVQSDFKSGGHGNFEAVITPGPSGGPLELWHYWHDNSDVNKPWQQGQRISTDVAAAGSIIQSDFRSGDHGNFEVVVPLFADDGTMELWHFWHDNSDVNKPWQRGQRIATNVAGAGSIIQSDFVSGGHGNFEVVVPVVRRWWHRSVALLARQFGCEQAVAAGSARGRECDGPGHHHPERFSQAAVTAISRWSCRLSQRGARLICGTFGMTIRT